MVPPPEADVDSVITAPPQVGPNMKHLDVWPGFGSSVDPSRVDRVQQALRVKIETSNSFDDPHRAVKKLFADADIDKNGILNEDEFVKLMVGKMNFSGYDVDVRALFKRFDIDHTGTLQIDEFCSMLFNEPGSRATTAIGKVREILTKRSGGVSSLKSLGLQFRLLDSDNGGTLNRSELELGLDKFMRGFGVHLAKAEVEELFKLFDVDNSGTITYDEFLKGIRGTMGPERVELVKLAFAQLDQRGKGYVTLEDIAHIYDVSGNPLVKAGKLSKVDAVKAFMSQWHLAHKKHTDDVTLDDFLEYYDWISASIDRDDYFELMIRNAWHIAGGEGWSANTSNLRVLVTHEDGHQSIETINNDLGLRRDDIEGIKSRLRSQGIKVKAVSVKGDV
jgi:Ca2+-binding EF-hand superfamily protein/biotin operon repressor